MTQDRRDRAPDPALRSAARADGWQHRAVTIVLPMAAVRAMFARAGKWSIEEGGRFDPRDDAIFLWPTARRRGLQPVGAFAVRWRSPHEDMATIRQISWNPSAGGSVTEMCRAVELLAGVTRFE